MRNGSLGAADARDRLAGVTWRTGREARSNRRRRALAAFACPGPGRGQSVKATVVVASDSLTFSKVSLRGRPRPWDFRPFLLCFSVGAAAENVLAGWYDRDQRAAGGRGRAERTAPRGLTLSVVHLALVRSTDRP